MCLYPCSNTKQFASKCNKLPAFAESHALAVEPTGFLTALGCSMLSSERSSHRSVEHPDPDDSAQTNSGCVTDEDLDDIPLYMEESDGIMNSAQGSFVANPFAPPREHGDAPDVASIFSISARRPSSAQGSHSQQASFSLAVPKLTMPMTAGASQPAAFAKAPLTGSQLQAPSPKSFQLPLASPTLPLTGDSTGAAADALARATGVTRAESPQDGSASPSSSCSYDSDAASDTSNLTDADLSSPPRVRPALAAPLPMLNLSSVGHNAAWNAMKAADEKKAADDQQPDSQPRSAHDSDRRNHARYALRWLYLPLTALGNQNILF